MTQSKHQLFASQSSWLWFSQHTRSLRISLILIVLILLAGTAGFMVLEGWNLLDSFYMTVTTLATVGFGEVHPLSPKGKLFTAGLIINGVGSTAELFSNRLVYMGIKLVWRRLCEVCYRFLLLRFEQ